MTAFYPIGPQDLALLTDGSSWGCGPLFEVEIRLQNRAIDELSREDAQRFLCLLNVDGPYQDVEKIAKGQGGGEWRTRFPTLGVWHLSPGCAVGIQLGVNPSWPGTAYLGIPPAHVRAHFGKSLWDLADEAGWVTEDAASLHMWILERVRNLHRELTVEMVLLRDEGWSSPDQADCRGAVVHHSVASRMKLAGERLGDYVRLPL